MNDLKAAMKARDKTRTGTLRMIIAAAKNEQIQKGGALSEDDFIDLLTRQAKQRREAADQFRAGDRAQMADQEEAELAVIQDYLPRAMTEDEVRDIIASLVAQTGASGARDMGKVMGPLMVAIRGRFDGKKASGLVRAALA